jgi:hypothetical protein
MARLRIKFKCLICRAEPTGSVLFIRQKEKKLKPYAKVFGKLVLITPENYQYFKGFNILYL